MGKIGVTSKKQPQLREVRSKLDGFFIFSLILNNNLLLLLKRKRNESRMMHCYLFANSN